MFVPKLQYFSSPEILDLHFSPPTGRIGIVPCPPHNFEPISLPDSRRPFFGSGVSGYQTLPQVISHRNTHGVILFGVDEVHFKFFFIDRFACIPPVGYEYLLLKPHRLKRKDRGAPIRRNIRGTAATHAKSCDDRKKTQENKKSGCAW